MKQRITTLLMVCILALSMSVSAFAANSTKITALYREPAIQVNVPIAGGLIINPYGLPVKVDGKVQSTAEIVNSPWSIENRSSVTITVDAKVSAKIAKGSTMELSERSAARDRSGNKLAFMYLDMRVTNPDVVLTDLNWSETVYSSRKQILITEEGNEREKIMTLAAVNKDGTTANNGVGAFHIGGNAAKKPDDPWNPNVDKVSIEIVFTFHPKG